MKYILLGLLSGCLFLVAPAEIHTINTNASSFSPATLSINLGDTILFNVTITHTATQVSEATWNANGFTPLPGGFDFSTPALHQFIPTAPGTHYYVCQNHVSMGMKGTFTVNPATGISRPKSDNSIRAFPTLARNFIYIEAAKGTDLNLNIFNSRGELVHAQAGLSPNEAIPLESFTNGLYFGILTDRERSYSWKFLKY